MAKLSIDPALLRLPFLKENSPAEDEEKVVTTGSVSESDSFGEPFVGAFQSTDKSVKGLLTRVGRKMAAPYRLTFTAVRDQQEIGNIVYANKPAAMKDWMVVQKGGLRIAISLLKKEGRHYSQQFDEAVMPMGLSWKTGICGCGNKVEPVYNWIPESSEADEIAEASGGEFAVVAIDDPAPIWKKGYGHTPEHKVVWQMANLNKMEVFHAAKFARKSHPHATISVENKSGKIVKVYKPGEKIQVSEAVMPKPGAAVKPPTEVERMRTRQAQEKIALQQRQANELMAAKLRDVQQKARQQQTKSAKPKSAAKPTTR